MIRTRTRIKICGITRASDAEWAAALGADAIGLVFVPRSPRCVTPGRAREIGGAAGGFVHRTGLFLDAPAAEVQQVLDSVPLDLLQFHGDESEDYCRQFGRPYLKAISAWDPLADIAERFTTALALVIDSHRRGQLGGTGERFDWSQFPGDSGRRLILAGGLEPSNVAAAILATHPYAVDVSSGVEAAPGIKDPDRMKAFFDEVRSADFG